MRPILIVSAICSVVFLVACQKDQLVVKDTYPAIRETFGAKLNPEALPNYANQAVPGYITKDNTGGNHIDDKTASLGRVLFYDKQLSSNNTISCSSCHQQRFAFSDPDQLSTGVNGLTKRHSMRLVNARFGQEIKFFWDERAATLEDQTTQPIQDHLEMGFSGINGAPDMADLLDRLSELGYYQELFTLAFGDSKITEKRIQIALAQFVRSIQSFDSKYDDGRAGVTSDHQDFSNFTALENEGKRLFMNSINGGASCAGCHSPPEFDISLHIGNNGVTGVPGNPSDIDMDVTRAPSLRDVVNPQGVPNGPLMHTGTFGSLAEVIEHYNLIPNDDRNIKLDNHLKGPNGQNQKLNLSPYQKDALVAFLKTLSGHNIYSDSKYSNPFPD